MLHTGRRTGQLPTDVEQLSTDGRAWSGLDRSLHGASDPLEFSFRSEVVTNDEDPDRRNRESRRSSGHRRFFPTSSKSAAENDGSDDQRNLHERTFQGH